MKTKYLSFILLIFSFSSFGQIIQPEEDLFAVRQRFIQGKTPKQVVEQSIENYEKFVMLDMNSPIFAPISIINQDSQKPRNLTKAQAEILVQEAVVNPVISIYEIYKYDKDNKGIGFCFGRAMFVHLYLAQAGFHRANIKKAFVVGPMMNGSWGWHIATMAQTLQPNGQEAWIVLDPVVGKAMEVKQWYRHWLASSDDGKLALFVATSGKFGATPSTYDERNKEDKFYNNYFTDMHKWFEDNADKVKLP